MGQVSLLAFALVSAVVYVLLHLHRWDYSNQIAYHIQFDGLGLCFYG